ncbi:MAG: response regulator [Acidobacteriota bacterium]|nr:MAG: response regulator [Acidobacteriota bacterium]
MERKKILVIDDEPDTVLFIATVLEDNGYRTERAADGERALQLIREEPPDLITLDITMPQKSGVAVYRFVKETEQYRDIPVIIITGISEDFRRFISTRRQVPPPEGYLSKPIEPDDLLKLVADLLQQRSVTVN